jgi:choline dehydrogenase-like flavoprotein
VARDPGAGSIRGALSLDVAVLEREQLRNGALLFYPRYESHEVFATREVKEFLEAAAKLYGKAVPGGVGSHLARALRAPGHVALAIWRKLVITNGPARRWRLRAMFETESRFDNRVTLAAQRDALGRPCARVEWRLGERDIHSMRRFMRLMDDAFRRHHLGRIVPAFPDDASAWRSAIIGGKHHMGTTRMHRDPALGVVDENAQVHGTTNLFVAGSSVFPCAGLANPTLTLVALAMRLADHIRR